MIAEAIEMLMIAGTIPGFFYVRNFRSARNWSWSDSLTLRQVKETESDVGGKILILSAVPGKIGPLNLATETVFGSRLQTCLMSASEISVVITAGSSACWGKCPSNQGSEIGISNVISVLLPVFLMFSGLNFSNLM